METVENENYEPRGNDTREWAVIRDACITGGDPSDFSNLDCNLAAAAQGTGNLQVIQKILACGCVLVLAESEGFIQ